MREELRSEHKIKLSGFYLGFLVWGRKLVSRGCSRRLQWSAPPPPPELKKKIEPSESGSEAF